MTKGRILLNSIIALAFLLTSSPAVSMASPVGKSWQLENVISEMAATEISDDWGWPMPEKPIPYHKPGRISTASQYTTQIEMIGENGLMQTTTLSGIDAMVADGLDPLAGNYMLLEWDYLLRSSQVSGVYGLETFSVTTEEGEVDIHPVPDSTYTTGNRSADIAAGDLNYNGQAEQITAWFDASNQVNLSIGEMPGSLGKSNSAPAAVGTGTPDTIDLLVRGYDYTLWHCEYNVITKNCV